MGDFGPAYMSSSRPTAQLYRCDDCSVTMPAAAASDDALCPSCGGTLRSLGVGGAAPPDASARTGVRGTGVSAAEMASVVLSEILSPGLLESLGVDIANNDVLRTTCGDKCRCRKSQHTRTLNKNRFVCAATPDPQSRNHSGRGTISGTCDFIG